MLMAATTILILLPLVMAGLCLLFGKDRLLNLWIGISATGLICASLYFAFAGGNGLIIATTDIPFDISKLFTLTDLAVLIVITYVGIKHKHPPIICFSVMQAGLFLYLESTITHDTLKPFIYADALSIIMLLIVSVIGSLICIFAIPYMKKHDKHTVVTTYHKKIFFATMLLFLGSMNGLILSNNILFLYTFFEITTICSFLLIGFDRTFVATKNAIKALWMNTLGGLSLLIAIALFYSYLSTFDIRQIISESTGNPVFMLPLCMLILASFIKSAQPPFQGWLLGAMVAPTPVSALLHSSTMVKVGVYLAIRFSSAYAGTELSTAIALFGAFVFLSAALSAIGQSNGKKILAYSTISNLGLIFVCAGIGTHEALAAGVFLIIFHAISKALLFLCTGTIEQRIGSRDIEDMRGIHQIMPFTSMLMVIGIVTIILPPFGMLMGKWLALEAVADMNLPVVLLLAVGSSATLLYWTRWAGLLLSGDMKDKITPDSIGLLTKAPLAILCVAALVISLFIPHIFAYIILPIISPSGTTSFIASDFALISYRGTFWVVDIFVVVLLAIVIAAWHYDRSVKGSRHIKPYMCGIGLTPNVFMGPMNKPNQANVFNYYFMGFCTEETSLKIFNSIALLLLVFMLGMCTVKSFMAGGIF